MKIKISVEVRKVNDGSYVGQVKVNGDDYAGVYGTDRDEVLRELLHYANQIEFDEEGNW